MQIPSTLRPKLITLDSPVKAAMLKSSQNLSLLNPAFPTTAPLVAPAPPFATPSLRKARSIESIPASPVPARSGHGHSPSLDGGPQAALFAPPRPLSGNFGTGSSFGSSDSSNFEGGMSRSGSMELLAPLGQLPNTMVNASTDELIKRKAGKVAKSNKDKEKTKERQPEKESTPEAMAAWLAATRGTIIDMDRLKRLRLLLRNETAACVNCTHFSATEFTNWTLPLVGQKRSCEVVDTRRCLLVSMTC